uniref:Uncharacterized protein n=1 Tax=Schlesneria paludicola TaxID=360056 RepID=A0A7C2K0Y1_9PLAN
MLLWLLWEAESVGPSARPAPHTKCAANAGPDGEGRRHGTGHLDGHTAGDLLSGVSNNNSRPSAQNDGGQPRRSVLRPRTGRGAASPG